MRFPAGVGAGSVRLANLGMEPKPLRFATLAVLLLLAAGVGAMGGTLAGQQLQKHLAGVGVADSASAIVDINTIVETGNGGGKAAGTGVVLKGNGEVLTNNHVVEGATMITVTPAGSSSSYEAQVVGVDPTADIALLQVSGVKGWPTVSFADSSKARVGDSVSAMGNALGLGGPPRSSSGKITALAQSITAGGTLAGTEQLSNLIQFDATVEPGESGGPLLDSSGRVLGLITASTGNGNVPAEPAYAIPANAALEVVRQIESGHASSTIILGKVGYMGVVVQDLSAANAGALGLSVQSGALVISVNAGSPAEGAGIRHGSVIVMVAGHTVATEAELRAVLHTYKPGQSVNVSWVDGTGTHSSTLTLASGPAV